MASNFGLEYVRKICESFQELTTELTNLGFPINNNNEMRWGQAPQNTNCYWSIDNTTEGSETINFITSEGEEAFLNPIINFDGGTKNAGLVFLGLEDDGCMLYLTPLDKTGSQAEINNLTYTCANNYDTAYVVTAGTQVNGLVVCTPAEQDQKWRYSWRDKRPDKFRWDVDNTAGYVSSGVEVPEQLMIPESGLITLVRAYLNSGYWSKYIFVEVLGHTTVPSTIFRLNGQKYITFTDNTTSRAPTFKIPADNQSANVHTSTEIYSINKTYAVGDYCIYDNVLYRCIVPVITPSPFDTAYWEETTVYQEKTR